ncbi:ATP synthase F0 subunit B [Acidicapsa acidisoli]|uniref:ATP synthase F0 subunit B n=1 Tax=Acidicapsa acidisoli TaxID=1615681 RepID=UPI0021DF48EA|nr:ATP synthase F0 subunit B [Acidicapsa acidisoli]
MILRKLSPRSVSGSIFLAVLIFGVSLSPLTLTAQASDSTAPTQPVPSASDSPFKDAHKEVKKSEADETQEYRHSASVQALAKLLHMDVDTAATGFEYINFAVILLAIGIPLFRILPKAMRERSEKLSKDLETARTATADANARMSAVEAQLAGLDAEIAAIRKRLEEEMREDEARIKASISEESARIVASAEQEIQVAAAQARHGLKEYAADLAIDRALSQLTLTEDTDRALIAEFARDSKASAGGQN